MKNKLPKFKRTRYLSNSYIQKDIILPSSLYIVQNNNKFNITYRERYDIYGEPNIESFTLPNNKKLYDTLSNKIKNCFKLTLKGCTTDLHDLCNLEHLKDLNLFECNNLVDGYYLPNLNELCIHDCSKSWFHGTFPNLTYLHINGYINGLNHIMSSTDKLQNLIINTNYFKIAIPKNIIGSLVNLQLNKLSGPFNASINEPFNNLETLIFGDNFNMAFVDFLESMPKLKTLYLGRSFTGNINSLYKLQLPLEKIRLNGIYAKDIDKIMNALPKLKELQFYDCNLNIMHESQLTKQYQNTFISFMH
jgi:hypothetical protein